MKKKKKLSFKQKQKAFIKKGVCNDIEEFNKYIGNDNSFFNMGIILQLKGGNQAFYFQGQLYRAWFFPNFGSQHMNWSKAKLEDFNKKKIVKDRGVSIKRLFQK